jgi:hypothetical protein
MTKKIDLRRASRIALNIPVVIESIGQPQITLHESLKKVYERVDAAPAGDGKVSATLRDLSTNGAFIAGEPMPLMSRVALSFEVPDFGRVEAIGWALWRRSDDCSIPREGGGNTDLPQGFGVLFEAVPLDARFAIHRLVQRKRQN